MDALTDLSIINRALGRIGGGTVFALDEDTDLARQVVPIHEDLIDAAFGLWRWQWARRTRKLERLAERPETGWAHAFAFPAGAASQPLRLMTDPRAPSNPLRAFQVEGREVHADADAVWGAFVLRVAPDLWPATFRLAYTDWLAARFCIPVTHDAQLAAQLEQIAVGSPSEDLRGGLMGRAISMDAAGANGAAPLAASDALTSARFDGGWSGGDTGW